MGLKNPKKCGWEFSSFDFAGVLACRQGKGKCAKLVIAKTGLSNPKSAVGKKKLKNAPRSVEESFCRDVKLYVPFSFVKTLGILSTDVGWAHYL